MTVTKTPRRRWLMPTGVYMKAKLLVVLLIPFAVNGCMMAGMAAMGGGGHMMGGGALHGGIADSARQPTVIREVMSGSLRVTASPIRSLCA